MGTGKAVLGVYVRCPTGPAAKSQNVAKTRGYHLAEEGLASVTAETCDKHFWVVVMVSGTAPAGARGPAGPPGPMF